jgi:hypothetical protein
VSVDPECPIVRMFHRDAMEPLFPPFSEVRQERIENWEKEHIKVCERCNNANRNHS